MPTNFTDKHGLKTIVMVVQSLPPLASGGAEIQALRLSALLKEKGVNVMFITPGQGKIKGYTEINGLPVYRLHSFLNYFIDLLFSIQKKSKPPTTVIEFDDKLTENNTINRKIGFGSRLRYNIFLLNAYFFLNKRKKDISVLHAHTIEWPAFTAAVLSKLLNKKLLIKDSTMNGIFNVLRFPSGWKKRQLIIRQGHFVAMTKIIKQNFLKAGITENKISEIPNGINTDGEYKTDYNPSGKVLFVGNLYQQPAKGVDILLKAWKILIKKYPAARLLIAGEGDLEAYRKYTEAEGIGNTVEFLGKHDNVASLMMDTDLFVLPSRREGMPNVLMEAMLRAVPCVASDISGSQDLITNGKNGLLVAPSDINSLAANLYFMLTHPGDAQNMGIKGRETILNGFDIRNVAGKYITLYGKI